MPCNLPPIFELQKPPRRTREEREAFAAENDRFVMLAASGQERKLRAAIERGAELDWKDNQGSTALMRAAASGEYGCAAILLAAGALVDALDSQGRTAGEVAAANGHIGFSGMISAEIERRDLSCSLAQLPNSSMPNRIAARL